MKCKIPIVKVIESFYKSVITSQISINEQTQLSLFIIFAEFVRHLFFFTRADESAFVACLQFRKRKISFRVIHDAHIKSRHHCQVDRNSSDRGIHYFIKYLFVDRVSSVLGREVKSYGKQYLFDGCNETCWNSDQVKAFSQLKTDLVFIASFLIVFVNRELLSGLWSSLPSPLL